MPVRDEMSNKVAWPKERQKKSYPTRNVSGRQDGNSKGNR